MAKERRGAGMKMQWHSVKWHLYTARLLLLGKKKGHKALVVCAFTILFLLARRWLGGGDSAVPDGEEVFDETPRTIYSMGVTDLSVLRRHVDGGLNRTLYLLPGNELRCGWRYNYFCKFYYSIRCHVLGGFSRVVLVQTTKYIMTHAREGDVALFTFRSKRHDTRPGNLDAINAWRHAKGAASAARALRVGVLHVSNERNRLDWPWYSDADFVLRNYWLPVFPPHVQYIPLGHQMPSSCIPESPYSAHIYGWCGCGNRTLSRGSGRRYLYSFSGSLRHGRSALISRIRQSRKLSGHGKLLISRKFGGDGDFDVKAVGNPKRPHVKSIEESAFVFAPCGNVMETHRIYEAIALGAIPVVQDCEEAPNNQFFPMRDLVFPKHEDMVAFVEQFVDRPSAIDELQEFTLRWWHSYTAEIATNVTQKVLTPIARKLIFAP